MRIKFFLVILTMLCLLTMATSAMAYYTYVGSWQVDQGPWWSNHTAPTASAREIAAMLFGGNASNYAISTVDSMPANIDHLAWYNGYGSGDPNIAPILPNGQGSYPAGSKLPENAVYDLNNNGIFDMPGEYSAYITDWAVGSYYTNYAFRVEGSTVPLPSALLLFGPGVAGLGLLRRRFTK